MGSIRKLKKRILKEELSYRRRKTSRRLLLAGLALVLLLGAGAGWYAVNQERFAERRFALAQALLVEKDYAAAARQFHQLARLYPHASRADEALFHLGELQHLYLGDDQRALLAFLQLEKSYPESPLSLAAQRQAADLYMDRLQDYGRAVVAYQKLLDQGVADGDQVQYRIGEAYFRLNNFEQARIEWDQLLAMFPASSLGAEAGYRSAVSLTLQGDFEQARTRFEKVFTTWPGHLYALEARFGLAAVFEEQGQLIDALDMLEKLRGVYPKPEVLEQRIAQVRERMEKKQKAI
jgi:TolA-binding protein